MKPAYVMGPTDILTVDKFNLMATPIVELSIADRVDDQNFLRNGNFYSAFWENGAGLSCPAGVETFNADYWSVNPTAAAVNSLRTTVVPDLYSLFAMEIQGNAGTTDVRVSQIINGDLSATLRRVCTFSGYIYSGAGLAISPQLELWTANGFNSGVFTLQQTEDLQTCANGLWTYVSVGFDLTNLPNIINGLRVTLLIPSGALSATTKNVIFSRLKLQIGELATEFTDDVALFVTTPSIDATMLQDGCIARPGLFMPNVIPTGTYQAKSIYNGDISDGAIDGRTLLQSVVTTLTAGFTQPAVAATVPVTVTSSTGFFANQPIVITGGGAYTISSITDATHMVVTNSGGPNNAAPAAAVPTGGNVYQAGAAIENLGFFPVNKAGDSNVGPLQFINDDVIGPNSFTGGAITVQSSAANANNAGYMPAIGFHRPGVVGRSIGLQNNGRLLAPISGNATQYYLLDNYFGVANADIQAGAITYDKLAQSLINIICPVGMVVPFAGVSPAGFWRVCDGSAISRTTYSALFAQLGTYWGGGDGSTTFNLPNFVNRVPVGYGSGASWGFGTYGGESAHQLSIAEMPGHDHGYSQTPHDHGTHSHTYTAVVGGGGSYSNALPVPYAAAVANTSVSGVPAANANINFVGQGGWAAHNNMQPFGVLYYIIKIL